MQRDYRQTSIKQPDTRLSNRLSRRFFFYAGKRHDAPRRGARIATNRSAVHELGGIRQRKRAAGDHARGEAEQTCALRMERIAQPADENTCCRNRRDSRSNRRRRCPPPRRGPFRKVEASDHTTGIAAADARVYKARTDDLPTWCRGGPHTAITSAQPPRRRERDHDMPAAFAHPVGTGAAVKAYLNTANAFGIAISQTM